MKSIAVGGGTWNKGLVRVWDIATGKLQWSASPEWGAFCDVSCLAWSPDGSRLAAGNHDGRVTIWDSDGRNERIAWKPWSIGKGATIGDLAWSHDGSRIVSHSGGDIHLWEVESGREIAIVADDALFRKREAEKGRTVATINYDCFHSSPRLAFAPDDRSVLIAGRTVKGAGKDYATDVWVWDLEANRESRTLARSLSRPTMRFVVTKDARQLITLSSVPREESFKHPDVAFTAHGWDFENGRQLWAGAVVLDPDKGESSIQYTNAISPDGRRVTLFWNTHTPAPNAGRVTIFELPQSIP